MMKLYFMASEKDIAQRAKAMFIDRYGQQRTPADGDVIVSLGGDGQTLISLQTAIRYKKPVYGINFGRVGFMQNLHHEDEDLIARIYRAEAIKLSPLRIKASFMDGSVKEAFAINEAHICNHVRTSGIHLRVVVDGRERIPLLGGDGLIVSTTVGSTGYNKSAHGPVLPLGDDLIALTPNNPYEPDGIRPSAIRPCPVEVEVLDPEFRQADLCIDNFTLGEAVKRVDASLYPRRAYKLLFDPGFTLHEKIMRTQFPAPRVA